MQGRQQSDRLLLAEHPCNKVMYLPTVTDDGAPDLAFFWIHLEQGSMVHERHGVSCELTATASGQFVLMLSAPPSGLSQPRRSQV